VLYAIHCGWHRYYCLNSTIGDIQMDIKQIDAKIKSIKTRGKNIDKDIHETGVAIMRHAMAHGDYSAANRLVAALPKSGRTKAFIKWFSDHTPYNWNRQGKGIHSSLKK
jgi:septal ring factor EnvC (AmiA/AmiB activator)